MSNIKGILSSIPIKEGIRHDDFLHNDLGDAVLNPGDDGFEEEMGDKAKSFM